MRHGIHNFHLPTAPHTSWCPEPFELRPLVRSHAGITRLGFVRWQMDALALLLRCFLRKGLGSCIGRASSDSQEDDKGVVWNGSDCMESSRPEFMLAFATASLPFGELHNLPYHVRCLLAGVVITLHHTQDSLGMTAECAVINIATPNLWKVQAISTSGSRSCQRNTAFSGAGSLPRELAGVSASATRSSILDVDGGEFKRLIDRLSDGLRAIHGVLTPCV